MLYVALIQKWNKAYNLVGTSDSSDLIYKHVLDSLSIFPYVQESPVIDVGSGAGLPGIPLAISLPDISFTLVDANGKKARFMRQACIELNLTNVEIVQARIEKFTANNGYKTVVSRAFAPVESALSQLGESVLRQWENMYHAWLCATNSCQKVRNIKKLRYIKLMYPALIQIDIYSWPVNKTA